MTIEKEVDKSSPILYMAVSRAMTLRSAEVKWHRTSEAGGEEEYFNTLMRNVKIVSVAPRVLNIKEQPSAHRNHFEIVELMYEEIQWSYPDGNLICKDDRNMVW